MNEPQHPTKSELAAYRSGNVTAETAAAIERHVEECQQCCRTLHDFSSISNTFGAPVKRADSNCKQSNLASSAEAETVELSSGGTDSQPAGERPDDIPSELLDHPRYRIVELLDKGGTGDVFKAGAQADEPSGGRVTDCQGSCRQSASH